jgi:hypothetical protein
LKEQIERKKRQEGVFGGANIVLVLEWFLWWKVDLVRSSSFGQGQAATQFTTNGLLLFGTCIDSLEFNIFSLIHNHDFLSHGEGLMSCSLEKLASMPQ